MRPIEGVFGLSCGTATIVRPKPAKSHYPGLGLEGRDRDKILDFIPPYPLREVISRSVSQGTLRAGQKRYRATETITRSGTDETFRVGEITFPLGWLVATQIFLSVVGKSLVLELEDTQDYWQP